MQIVPRDLIVSLFIMLLICLSNYIFRKEKQVCFLVGNLFLTGFMVVIFSLTGISPISGFHKDIYWNAVQFVPFKTIESMINSGIDLYVFENIFGNILMFVPLGFLLPILSTKMQKWYWTVFVGAVVSLGIEVSQLFLVRSTDIDDLILNTCGVVLGYICYKMIQKMIPKLMKLFCAKRSYDKWLIICGILVPYIVIILCGFYDRNQLFSGGY